MDFATSKSPGKKDTSGAFIFVIFDGLCTLKISGKDRHSQGIASEIRYLSTDNDFGTRLQN